MRNAVKGALAFAASVVAITLIWLAATAGQIEGGDCIDPPPGFTDGCQCNPVERSWIIGAGLGVALPCAIVVGGVLGALAGRMPRGRHAMLVTIAVVLAIVSITVAQHARGCRLDELVVPAFGGFVVAALVVGWWTRPSGVRR